MDKEKLRAEWARLAARMCRQRLSPEELARIEARIAEIKRLLGV